MFPYLEHNHQEDGLQNHRTPLYPSLSLLITSLQTLSHNATSGSQPSSLWEWLKYWSSFEKSAHYLPPELLFLADRPKGQPAAVLAGAKTNVRDANTCSYQCLDDSFSGVMVWDLFPSQKNHSRNPLAVMYVHSHTIPPRDSLSPSKSQTQKSFMRT